MRKIASIIIAVILIGCSTQRGTRINGYGEWCPDRCDRYMDDHGCEE